MRASFFLFSIILCSINVIEAQWYQQASGTNLTLRSVSMFNQNIGYIVGDSGIILKTTNGGMNWVKQKSDSSTFLYGVKFCDSITGTVVGSNGFSNPVILHTTNGGINWINQQSPLNATLFGISLIDNNTGYIAGIGGVLSTTNGGENWVVHHPPQLWSRIYCHFISRSEYRLYCWI